MIKSETLGALATALSLAQGEFDAAVKDTANPFFKSKYADLSSVVEATRPALSKHGLSIIQLPRSQDGCIQLETILLHKSGEFIGDTLALPVSKQDAQGYGSAMTYARRYGWMAVTGIAPEDDDGNAAVQGKTPAAVNTRTPSQAKRLSVQTEGQKDWTDVIARPDGVTERNAAQSREAFKMLADCINFCAVPEDLKTWADDNKAEIYALSAEGRHHLRDKYDNKMEDMIAERVAA
jgi:hypothetical protein